MKGRVSKVNKVLADGYHLLRWILMIMYHTAASQPAAVQILHTDECVCLSHTQLQQQQHHSITCSGQATASRTNR